MPRQCSPASKEKRHYKIDIQLIANWTICGSSAAQRSCTSVQYIGEEFGPKGGREKGGGKGGNGVMQRV